MRDVKDENLAPASDDDGDPPANRPPDYGLTGDGLTTYEEYRGFVFSPKPLETSQGHFRTDPHVKDVFIKYDDSAYVRGQHPSVPDMDPPDYGLGLMAGSPFATHRLFDADHKAEAINFHSHKWVGWYEQELVPVDLENGTEPGVLGLTSHRGIGLPVEIPKNILFLRIYYDAHWWDGFVPYPEESDAHLQRRVDSRDRVFYVNQMNPEYRFEDGSVPRRLVLPGFEDSRVSDDDTGIVHTPLVEGDQPIFRTRPISNVCSRRFSVLLNDVGIHQLVQHTIAHEGGHGIGMLDYNCNLDGSPSDLGIMFGKTFSPVPRFYLQSELDQLRLHDD